MLPSLKIGHSPKAFRRFAQQHDALVDYIARIRGTGIVKVLLSEGGMTITSRSLGGTGPGNITLPLDVPNGGTNITSYSAGDMLYATGATTLAKLGIGSNGAILRVVSSAPAWSTANYTFTACVNGAPMSFDIPIFRGPY